MLVDLLGLSILAQQSTKHSLSTHPEYFEGGTGILCALAATITGVSSLVLRLNVTLVSGLGVYGVGLAHDEAVLDQLSDILSAVGGSDFSSLVGVKPDLLLAAFQHGRREATVREIIKE